MSALLIMVLAFAGYLIMYNFYGRFIGKKIFNLTRRQAFQPWKWKMGLIMYLRKKR